MDSRERNYFHAVAAKLYLAELPFTTLGAVVVLLLLNPRTNPFVLTIAGVILLLFFWARLGVARTRRLRLWYFLQYQQERNHKERAK